MFVPILKTEQTLFCTPSDHHPPTSIPTLWIAYSEISSPFWLAGSAVCRTGTSGSQWGACLFGCSFSGLSRPRRSLVRSCIEDIKTDTIPYAIRPPPSNLHSYPVDAHSKLNSLSRPAGQHLVVSELAVVGGVLGCWTFVQSF